MANEAALTEGERSSLLKGEEVFGGCRRPSAYMKVSASDVRKYDSVRVKQNLE